jgi:hypothetical protein
VPPSPSSSTSPSPPHPPVLEPDRRQSFKPTLHRRSHHPVSPPSPPPCRFPGLPSVVPTAADDGSRGCSQELAGKLKTRGEHREEGNVVLVLALGWRERRLFHGGGVSRGRGPMAAVPCYFLTPAEPPPRLRSKLRRPLLASLAGESALQRTFSSFDTPAECRPRRGSHRSIVVSSPPSIVSRQCHLLPHRVSVQPPRSAEIPLSSPAPPRPSHAKLTHEPLRSRCRRLQ